MQFNSNLIQSFLGQSKGAKTASADTSNLLGAPEQGGATEFSNEFLSLLGETKALAESGISPEEFIETLNSEDLGLTGGEKKALTNSFIGALEGETNQTPEGSTVISENNIQKEVFSSKQEVDNSDISKIINSKSVENNSIESLIKKTNLNTESISKNSKISQLENIKPENIKVENTEVEKSELIDPKITNGKLLNLKEHSSKKMVAPGSFQSSEDFVAQAKVAASKNEEVIENNERKSFFPKSNNKVLAFNKEQNTINNNIFAGKNPFLSGNETKVSKLKPDTEVSTLDTGNIAVQEESLAPLLSQTQQNSSGNQSSLGNNSTVKVLDFSNINTANSEQLIDKISNYITTSRLEKQEHVELIVKHNSLGNLKVTATKGQLPDQINLEIVASSDKGHQFFKSNEVEMIKSLSNSGVKLNDVKISMGSDFNMQSSDKGDSQFNQGQGSQNSKYGGQQASSNQDQSRRDRREQMWNTYRERLGA
ncbi:hypothetical protein [Halobacteriovorax sp.]|uniref:hypothetical protein n=1 Tax=Halobacteriovorax sp. TaxID=2020862 RepID=UPI00356A0573